MPENGPVTSYEKYCPQKRSLILMLKSTRPFVESLIYFYKTNAKWLGSCEAMALMFNYHLQFQRNIEPHLKMPSFPGLSQ